MKKYGGLSNSYRRREAKEHRFAFQAEHKATGRQLPFYKKSTDITIM
jgi:hypothetical protein